MKIFHMLVAGILGLGGAHAATVKPVKPKPVTSVPITTPLPAECDKTYGEPVHVNWGGVYTGTPGNDLVFVDGGAKIQTDGGDDCVITGYGSSVQVGSGDDVVVLNGGAGADGGTGTDTLIQNEPKNNGYTNFEVVK